MIKIKLELEIPFGIKFGVVKGNNQSHFDPTNNLHIPDFHLHKNISLLSGCKMRRTFYIKFFLLSFVIVESVISFDVSPPGIYFKGHT